MKYMMIEIQKNKMQFTTRVQSFTSYFIKSIGFYQLPILFIFHNNFEQFIEI